LNQFVCYQGKNSSTDCEVACENCDSYREERRKEDRRGRSGFSLKLLERRDGFDRRKKEINRKNPYQLIFTQGAHRLRNSEYALVWLLVLFNLFNIADYLFTLKALASGFREGNPVMDMLFSISPLAAAAFKILLTLLITTFVWLFKRYRIVLEICILFIIMYMMLIAYHIYGAILYY
jgi:hypothetical protein